MKFKTKKREEIIFALARCMRPEHFKKVVDERWRKLDLEKLLDYYMTAEYDE